MAVPAPDPWLMGLQGEECSQMLPSTLLQSPASPLPPHAVSPHWLLQPGLPPSISLEAPHPPSLPRNLVQGPAGHPAYPRLCLSLSAEPSRDTTLRGTVWSGHPGVDWVPGFLPHGAFPGALATCRFAPAGPAPPIISGPSPLLMQTPWGLGSRLGISSLTFPVLPTNGYTRPGGVQ